MMSLIDRAKSLHQRVLDWTTPQRVIFHHVPKCGGTSVGRSLRTRYLLSQGTVTPESSFRAFEAFSGRTDREKMLIDVLDLREQMMLYLMCEDVRCISLHVRFSRAAYLRFSPRYKFITVIREPVARFISHYFWSYGKSNAHGRIDEPFAEFLDTERARRLGATYVEFFSGLPKEADIYSDSAINSAVSNLRRFDVVGKLEDMPAFQRNLCAALGVRMRIGHENRGGQTSAQRATVVSPELRSRVEKLCAPDLAVWNGYLRGEK